MRRFRMLAAAALFAGAANAIGYPPYEVYPYLAETTDNPPVNYMKVVEPGRQGEANASYVILGISFPRTYQAVSTGYDGDLVVPAYIDGLPVRKINEAAFVECTKLRSVSLPSTLREVGDRAFADCYSLTNVTFENGVNLVGNFVFTNCLSLSSVRFPKSLSRLGSGCFQGCLDLRDVYFDGNAPRLVPPVKTVKSAMGESIFRAYGYYERAKFHIRDDTYGWVSPYEKGVPEKWPIDCGYMQAHETVAEHVVGSVAEETGFVAVVTEVVGESVAVPESWTERFAGYAAKFGDDFAASLLKPTGKADASGNPMKVWQDYVAGTDPTDADDRFTAVISVTGGTPVVSVRPELAAEEKARRRYTLFGRTSLFSGEWSEISADEVQSCNFFKVRVEMR